MSKPFNKLQKSIESMDRVTFGKHSGNTWFWVVEHYPDYVIWCVGNTDMKFSYDLIVDAIKSKYKKKKEAAENAESEGDKDDKANAHLFNNGRYVGVANVFASIEDKHSNGFQGGRFDGFMDIDDDIPF